MILRSFNISKKHSFFLFGARGTGKSTWLQSNFIESDHFWIDLTDPKTERRYARRPEILLEEWKSYVNLKGKINGPEPWIVIDEVQKIPQILDVVHVGIQRHKIKFALTGSSARKLKRGAANLLAGRALSYNMHPFTYLELGNRFVQQDYLNWGGLPMISEIDNDSDKKKYLDSYVDTYIREEIQIEQLVRKIEPFRMFLDVIGQMNGEVVNIAKISREAGIDPKSGERYFEILQDTLLGYFLPCFDQSVRKSQIQHPKFYLFDIGIARALRKELTLNLEPHTSLYGRYFEQFVIQQIRSVNDYKNADYRLSYLRTKDGNESDLVIKRPARRPLFVEIKSTDKPEQLSIAHFQMLAKDAKAESIVLCNCSRPYEIGETQVLPWQQGIDLIFAKGDPIEHL
jgi:uncharacterized protein